MEEIKGISFLEATREEEKTSLEREVEFWRKVAEQVGLEVSNVVTEIELVPKSQWKSLLNLALVELKCGMVKPILLTEEGKRASLVDLFDFEKAFGEVEVGDYRITGDLGRIKAENTTRPLYAEYEAGLALGGSSPEIKIKKGDLRAEWKQRVGGAEQGWELEYCSPGDSAFALQVDQEGHLKKSLLIPTRIETYSPEEPGKEIGTGISCIVEGEKVVPPMVTIVEIGKVSDTAKEVLGGKQIIYSRFDSHPLPEETRKRVLSQEKELIVSQHRAAFSKMFPGHGIDQPLDVPKIVSDLLLKP